MLRDVCCLLQSHQQLPKWEMRQHCSTPTPAQALGLTPLHDPASPADALDASMAMPACEKGAGAAPARHASHCSVSSMKDMMMAAAAQVSWQPCWHVEGLWHMLRHMRGSPALISSCMPPSLFKPASQTATAAQRCL